MNPKAEGPRPKASTSPNRLLFCVRFLRFFRVLEAPRASPQAGPRSPQAPRAQEEGLRRPPGRAVVTSPTEACQGRPSVPSGRALGEGRFEELKGGRGGAVIPRSLVRTAPMFRECHGCPRHSLPCPRGRHLQSSSASAPTRNRVRQQGSLTSDTGLVQSSSRAACQRKMARSRRDCGRRWY